MATIRATWKRSVRVREYETETLELSVERGWDEMNDGDAVKAAADLDRDLAEAGDALLVERMDDRLKQATKVGKAEKSGRPAVTSPGPVAPDPFV